MPGAWLPLPSSATGEGSAPALLHARDEKPTGTQGGTFTSGAWQTRDLNTVRANEIAGASLVSNELTLPAGTYEIDATCPAFDCGRHQSRLFNVTGAAALIEGTSAYSATSGFSESFLRGRFTLPTTSNIRVEHRCQTTKATSGFGVYSGFGTEVYADVQLRQVA